MEEKCGREAMKLLEHVFTAIFIEQDHRIIVILFTIIPERTQLE
jgi:hypothetical protein